MYKRQPKPSRPKSQWHPFRNVSLLLGHPSRKEAETYSSGNCRRFARRSLIRLPDGPPVGIEPRHVRKDTKYIGTKYPQKQKQPGRRADSTETGKSAATSIRSGIPRAARVKDRRNRSAQRYSSMSVSCEPIRDRSGRRQAVAPLLTEAARRSINTTGFASGERKSARKKTDIFPQGNRLGIFPCTAASRHEQPANGGKRTKRLRFCIASYRTKQAPTRKQSTKNKRLWKKSNRPHSKKRTRPR